MRNSLWSIFAVVGAVMGFLMGYATAPMVEYGMLGAQGARPEKKMEGDKAIERYYKDLYKEH